ncbi:hypothetical protein [Streptomyces sp. NPDC048565]|uniref:hypothetical protein n=1 Tax=Streptomyces sp. NPDC048565 TaxID=3155266 RepID=UPI00342CC819
MTGADPQAMDVGRVAKGKKFNAGGQGSVWAVEGRTINGCWPVAYKEYHARMRPDLKADVLSEMVGFVPSLPRGVGRWLAGCTAWPAVLVTDSAGVSGFLMRQIPERFFRRFAFDPDKPQPAGFQYLLNPPAYFVRAGFDITPRQRFELLLDLAGTLVRLHSLGVVVGDVSPNNVLFCLDGTASCFLIDCDAMSLHGKWALPAVETPNWALPSGERMGATTGDTYKFALLAARLFAGEQDGRDVTLLRAADQAVGRLAEQSLSDDPARRPVMEQWLGVLAAAVTTAPATLPRPPFGPSAGTAPASSNAGQPQQPPSPVPNTPPPVPPGATTRTAVPRTGKSKAGRRFTALVLIVLAVVYGPDLYDTWKQESRSADSGSTGLSEDSLGSSSPDPSAEETEGDQLRSLGGLLERNEGNRGDVGEAVSRMTTCPGSSGLREVKEVFEDAATERDELVRDLKGLDPDLLSSSMTADLRSGWQASADADRAYALLAEEAMGGCTSQAVMSSSHWQDASRASTRATRAKKDFVAAWNPLAEQHGLATLSWDEV